MSSRYPFGSAPSQREAISWVMIASGVALVYAAVRVAKKERQL